MLCFRASIFRKTALIISFFFLGVVFHACFWGSHVFGLMPFPFEFTARYLGSNLLTGSLRIAFSLRIFSDKNSVDSPLPHSVAQGFAPAGYTFSRFSNSRLLLAARVGKESTGSVSPTLSWPRYALTVPMRLPCRILFTIAGEDDQSHYLSLFASST